MLWFLFIIWNFPIPIMLFSDLFFDFYWDEEGCKFLSTIVFIALFLPFKSNKKLWQVEFMLKRETTFIRNIFVLVLLSFKTVQFVVIYLRLNGILLLLHYGTWFICQWRKPVFKVGVGYTILTCCSWKASTCFQGLLLFSLCVCVWVMFVAF